MRAEFEVKADGEDITLLLKDRLLGITIVDKTGLESDSCEIRLDDREGKVAVPPKGATLSISLGWAGEALHYMGRYKVDEVRVEGPPAVVTIRGKATDLRQDAKSQRSVGYEDTTLAAIVEAIAGRHGWTPVCGVDAKVPRIDQLCESDLNFITRLAGQHGATATVKDGKLLVMPRGGGASASGGKLTPVEVTPAMLSSYSFTFADRSSYAAVRTKAHDPASGKQIDIDLTNAGRAPDAGAINIDRKVYANADAARAAAASRLEALNRATVSGNLNLIGRADIAAEKTIRLSKLKAEVDGDYLVESVTHNYSGQSWQMDVALNGGNVGKAQAGHAPAAKNVPVPKLVTKGLFDGVDMAWMDRVMADELSRSERLASLGDGRSSLPASADTSLKAQHVLNDNASFKVYLAAVAERDKARLALAPLDVRTSKELLFNKYGYAMGKQSGTSEEMAGSLDEQATDVFKLALAGFHALTSDQQDARYAFYTGISGGENQRNRQVVVTRDTRRMTVDWTRDFSDLARDCGVSANEALRKTDFEVYQRVLDAAFATPKLTSFAINGAWRPSYGDYCKVCALLEKLPGADKAHVARMKNVIKKNAPPKSWSSQHVSSRALDINRLNGVATKNGGYAMELLKDVKPSIGPDKEPVRRPILPEPELVKAFSENLLKAERFLILWQPWRMWSGDRKNFIVNRGASYAMTKHSDHMHFGLISNEKKGKP